MEDNNTSDVPIPCAAGCGFYGSKIYNNMCSKCFREQSPPQHKKEAPTTTMILQHKQTPSLVGPTTAATAVAPASPAPDNEALAIAVEQPGQDDPVTHAKPVQKNPGRCFMCRAKIPLAKQVSNKCRCDYVFCDNHRYPDKHDCDFDHASMDKDILAKKNPKLNEWPRGGRSFQRLDSL